ncbi:MAG: pyrimidine reductase, partial [Alistipes sp.]|nr:pyrimidine reductase [Alistipes sp.]
VRDAAAPHFDVAQYVGGRVAERRNLGGMEVATYRFDDTDVRTDERFMRMAIEYSRRSAPCATAYRVGAVAVTASGEVFAGYTHETTPTSHAEQEAVRKALQAGADLRGATIYSSLEPCTSRKSEPESCSQIIIRLGFRRVVFAMREPEFLAHCVGVDLLRRQGIRVDIMPRFAAEVADINAHIR